jgi:hypothetical protein
MTCVLGLEEETAAKILEAEGKSVIRREYLSKRGVEEPDSSRVIRQRLMDNNEIEITVSRFRTKIL